MAGIVLPDFRASRLLPVHLGHSVPKRQPAHVHCICVSEPFLGHYHKPGDITPCYTLAMGCDPELAVANNLAG